MSHVDRIGNKWAAGPHYGPILTPTDLYLLDCGLEIHPVLARQYEDFEMLFNIMSGQTGGTSASSREDLPFIMKDEPAVLPRVSEIVLLTKSSPWVTVIRNQEKGVTLADVCTILWKDYTEHAVTETEFNSLPARYQDLVRRQAGLNQHALAGLHSPRGGQRSLMRCDWLREKQWFERLLYDERYTHERLGYHAHNVFVFETTQ